MIIPLLGALLPSVVKLAEGIFSKPDSGAQKKEFVLKFLGWIYDRFLADKIPDFPGIDERALFIEAGGFLIDQIVEHTFNKKDGQ